VLKNAELDALEAHMDFEIWCRTSHQGGMMPCCFGMVMRIDVCYSRMLSLPWYYSGNELTVLTPHT
jgi:hypothetical protein